tara:strand:- start:218 stop:355 length:138 start_codon:yes stop_codon:yes gene_type:complete
MERYGVPLEEAPYSYPELLVEAYEEALDQVIYIKELIRRYNDSNI